MNTRLKPDRELKGRVQLMAIESGLCPMTDDGTYDTANFEKFWCLWKHDNRNQLANMALLAEQNKSRFFLAGLATGLAFAAIAIALIPLLQALKQLLLR